MGNGDSGDQGNLPACGNRDVRTGFDGKQHDWSEQARAKEVNALSSTQFITCTFITLRKTF